MKGDLAVELGRGIVMTTTIPEKISISQSPIEIVHSLVMLHESEVVREGKNLCVRLKFI